ncbi:MAG: phage BR0599 family protein [Candidatus Acidiferrales bacterium]
MTFDAIEQQGFGAEPYELYLFQGQGVSYALTSSDEEITYLGQVYSPATISRDELDQSNEVISGQVKVYLPNDHPLAQLMLPYLPPSPISLTIYGGHFGDANVAVLFIGNIASARFTDECELVCYADQYRLQRKIPTQVFQSQCTHIFGDAGCGVDLTEYTYAGTVTAIDSTGTILTIPAFASLPQSLTGGYLQFGNQMRAVVTQSGETITLLSPLEELATGTAVSGVAGCALTFTACTAYKNVSNFLGFDLIPILNPFDGSASIG